MWHFDKILVTVNSKIRGEEKKVSFSCCFFCYVFFCIGFFFYVVDRLLICYYVVMLHSVYSQPCPFHICNHLDKIKQDCQFI